MLKQKQKEQNSRFISAWNGIQDLVSKTQVDNRIDRTVEAMKPVLNNKRYGMAWSGGKDSVVLDHVIKQLGKEYPSCLGMTNDLEYPEFLSWVTVNMPDDLMVVNSGHSLLWLADNQEWLFPKTSEQAAKWFKAVQHHAQNKFVQAKRLDILLTGRRRLDMNYTGVNGIYTNKASGITRYSPLYDWTHEEVLACMSYYRLPVAPFYRWPNGFVVGSGNWAARQWTGSVFQGWRDIAAIDRTIVLKAAEYIDSAKEYVRVVGV
jgi:3'-phosphoadenosine 5'-phosphosulfate sulfotransferase (PAPS reductase)/FAD synthetase